MSKEQTIKAIQSDIDQGNLGRARDRLHGLISSYPNDLELRVQLADIYSRLQHPAMAGRYWYLEENKTEKMIAAVTEFERSCGKDPLQILLALKFQGSLDAINYPFAKERLLSIQQECKDKYLNYPEFGLKGAAKWKQTIRAKAASALIPKIFITILILFVILAFIGLFTVVSWLW